MTGYERECAVVGCGNTKISAKGMCSSHYNKWKRYGDPTCSKQLATTFFLETVLTYRGDECLIWPFSRVCGYASISVDGETKSVSRQVCEKLYGQPSTPDLQAAHSCGKGDLGCCAPNHLRWATRSQNEADKLLVGTSNRGSRHGMSVLTERQVLEIKAIGSSMQQKLLAEKYGVNKETIRCILIGRSWGWLQPANDNEVQTKKAA